MFLNRIAILIFSGLLALSLFACAPPWEAFGAKDGSIGIDALAPLDGNDLGDLGKKTDSFVFSDAALTKDGSSKYDHRVEKDLGTKTDSGKTNDTMIAKDIEPKSDVSKKSDIGERLDTFAFPDSAVDSRIKTDIGKDVAVVTDTIEFDEGSDLPPISPDTGGDISVDMEADVPLPVNEGSLYYDGTNDYVVVPHNHSLSLFSELTIEVWVKPEDSGLGRAILGKRIDGPIQQYSIERNYFGSAVVSTGNLGGTCTVTGGSKLFTENNWTHVGLSWKKSRGTPRLYIDGQMVNQSYCQVQMGTGVYDLFFGTVNKNGVLENHFKGWLDEIRIWNKERSALQIQATMLTTLSGLENSLMGYWRFDEGVGDTAGDSSGQGNNAQLGNTYGPDQSDPLWSGDKPF